MTMVKEITIQSNLLYRFLIWGCRYGYTRNNSIMPEEAFSVCQEILPKQFEVDSVGALRTAQQLCDECISNELMTHFYDGNDDGYDNRYRSIEFIYWLLRWIKDNGGFDYKPYGYDFFLENVALDDKPQYLVTELFGFNMETRNWDSSKVLNANHLLSKKNYFDFIVNDVCNLKGKGNFLFNKMHYFKDECELGAGKSLKFIYRFLLETPRTFLVEKQKID